MKLSDLTGFFKTYKLPLLRSYAGGDHCTVFEFDITGKNINWIAGQHSIFTIPKKKIATGKKWRAFSIASIPEENVVRIATKIGDNPSSFKAALLSLQPGEMIKMRGPYGWLYPKKPDSPIVMIAGGVGITPFRAIFESLTLDNHRNATLIYSALEDDYLFKDKLDIVANQNPNINILYIHTIEDMNNTLAEILKKHTPATEYFISGSPGMVKAIRGNLNKGGVAQKMIFTDSFRGY